MLEELKSYLGIPSDNTDNDSTLKLIISTATARLSEKLGGVEVPESLDYIVREVSIKRYNRLGSEGMSSHTVEGESSTYSDNDFAEFEDEIQSYINRNKTAVKGRLMFL